MSIEQERRSVGEGSLREVVTVAWPIVVSMLSYTAMGVTDTLLVGWVGKTELAGVGLATTAVFLINSFFMGTLHGVKVLSAQATGAEKHDLARNAAWQGAYLAVVFGAILAAASMAGTLIFEVLGGPAEVRSVALEYFSIRVLGGVTWYVSIAIFDYFQGTGDTKTPMKLNLVVNGLNIVLDMVLIFGLGPIEPMGVAGAALATIMASSVGMVLAIVLLTRRVGRPVMPDVALGKKIAAVGIPIGVRYLLDVGGFAAFTAILARMGEDELAANQIAIKILSMSFLPGYGISEAASVLAGQYVGAKNHGAVVRTFWSSIAVSVGIMGIFGVIFWFAPEALIGIFQDDKQVLEIGTQLLFLAAIFQVFDAVAMTATGALNGTGDTRFTMFASVAGSWLVQVPLAYLFGVVLNYGAAGAWMGLTVEIIFLAVIMTARFHLGGWKSKALVTS